ncbi:MAG: carbamoyl-phosphate synthase large subunit, partial [Candidatus Latescibacterota bacterium]
GPIVIGQGCEFDYSGTQAIRALREEGIRVVLLNSNPATIMTDPGLSDATYIEPLTAESCIAVIEAERCDAILPTLGGQTALNLACELSDRGEVEKRGIQLLGVNLDAIRRAEDRRSFRRLAIDAGCEVPRSAIVKSMNEARDVLEKLGLPLIVRPSFTLGGSGAGLARDRETFLDVVASGIHRSPIGEVLLEESVEGWKEFELEVMRDAAGNCVVICSIENLDPMGTHTGDSVTVAPVQTLCDKDYQRMRDAAFRIMELVGISGGANVQFALQPGSGRLLVIEMNPRVSRSSALASKATGYPIAKVATKLALGYTLHELPNDIVGSTPASFEPALDYCVVKIPRWNFEKFKGACDALSPQMKSVGEVLALGRTFNEALQKALRSLEAGLDGLEANGNSELNDDTLRARLCVPNPERLLSIKTAFSRGWTVEHVHDLTQIDVWFLENIRHLTDFEGDLRRVGFPCGGDRLLEAKRLGFGDRQLADILGVDEPAIARVRSERGIRPAVRMVDTCAAEFAARTPYFYTTYGEKCEADAADPKSVRKIMILGSGPNRIGQGIEFDYCCVHAAMELQNLGIETIMVNCNPETVSTDFDVSSRLYFEPITFEHVMAIIDKEKPDGVIVQFGGQTPLKLLHRLHESGVTVLGTNVESVDRAEDRKRCSELLTGLGIRFPASTFVTDAADGMAAARRLGFPLLLRPPYVLGGMDMELVYDEEQFERSLQRAFKASDGRPLMLDRFIESATEVDVDVVSDGTHVEIAGIMEHIEEAGIHSGDSSCVLPPVSLEDDLVEQIRSMTTRIARELDVVGMLNVQYAVRDDTVFCIEINPRASRTVPFVSKATGIPWVKVATRAILGLPLANPDAQRGAAEFVSVKAPVLPFDRFPGVDSLLGPEMRATGEVMGIAPSFGEAFIKAQMAAGFRLPAKGKVFISVANRFKRECIFPAKTLAAMGHSLVATSGTAKVLRSHGIRVEEVPKVSSGDSRIIELINNEDIVLVINTPVGKTSIEDERAIRLAATQRKVPCITTMQGFHSLVLGLDTLQDREFSVAPLQEYVRRYEEVAG